MRVPTDWKPAIDAGRMLIVSPFAEEQNRPTANMAAARSQMIAHLARAVFIAYAEPGGKTEAFATQLLADKRPVLTFDTDANRSLLQAGAQTLTP